MTMSNLVVLSVLIFLKLIFFRTLSLLRILFFSSKFENCMILRDDTDFDDGTDHVERSDEKTCDDRENTAGHQLEEKAVEPDV